MLLNLIRRALRGARAPIAASDRLRSSSETTDDASAGNLIAAAHRMLEANDLLGARQALEHACAIDVNDADSRVLLASLHGRLGDLTNARALIDIVLEHDASNAAAYDTLGNLCRIENKLEDAIAAYDRALDCSPNLASALSNRALCFQDRGEFEQARATYELAVGADPTNMVMATNLATVLFDLGEDEAALAWLNSVLTRARTFEQAHQAKALGLLRKGRYLEGWREYEWRERPAGEPPASARPMPEWDGRPLDNSLLLVRAEQGLGDQIMFASCIPDLLAVAPRCVLECDARLKPLFSRSFPSTRLYAQRKRVTNPWLDDGHRPDAVTRIGSLPLRFRSNLDDFPKHLGYLRADPEKTLRWKRELASLGAGLKIGISWRGGLPTTRRAVRSIPLPVWLPLLRSSDTHFVSLQYGDSDAERAAAESLGGIQLKHWSTGIDDYDETAALVYALDLVISVQTAIVHLAGALGKPVWTLIPHVAEWRYGTSGDSMPWYPSARLFRQQERDGWGATLESVRTALDNFSVGTRQERTYNLP